jgi:predicted ATP-dependent protease
MVDSQHKLSARFGLLADLVIEASHRAAIAGDSIVSRAHVKSALEGRIERSSRISDTIREMMLEGTLIVDLDGERIGQVNGLSVYGDGDVMFGRPSKITVRSFMGVQGVVNVEREVELTGRSHDKGVLILAGYLGATFAKKTPLSVNVSIVFEQSYGMIDGDSASSTELYAILSSLSGLPIRQNIAVTGSINQFGDIQPIGGVNEKIEGYYDLCKASGKLGTAGVIIPKRNLANLMLREDVLDSIDDGEFHVYAVEHVNEGIEILTGVEAGSLDENGEYPPESVNGLVNAQFIEYAVGLREFGSTPPPTQVTLVEIQDDEESEIPESPDTPGTPDPTEPPLPAG